MKLNKEQLKAIESLLLDIDELDNKPRRLFYALEEFAFAFDKKDAVPSIREAQDSIYKHINEGELYRDLFSALREFTINEWANQIKIHPEDKSTTEERISGARDFIKQYIKQLNEY